MTDGSDDLLHFGPFALSTARRELRRGGDPVEVGQRGLDLLSALLADAGRPITKEALIQAAWGERLVEPSNLTVQIAKLRQVLTGGTAQSATAEPFIKTVPGFGYVFTAPVERVWAASPSARADAAPHPGEPPTLFIGREHERRELARMLDTSRLVTLTGIGGVGKTRLTMRLRQELAAGFGDGVAFVDLAPLAEAVQVIEAVANAVGASGGTAAEVALSNALQGRRLLLILDNAEHLVAAVQRLLTLLLPQCPSLTVLVTSRDSLGLPGEVVFRLLPLGLPAEGERLTATEALGYDSVRLLVDRAQALLPGFAIDDAAAPHIAEICRRLDGIALAIEMAVPRLEVLTVRQLAERLHDRFGVLAPARHDVPPRQRTLLAMFDWSWELLAPGARRLLQLLAASAAGSTLDLLEALAAADASHQVAAPGRLLDELAALVQGSLVVVGTAHGPAEPRYRLLETTRQYALDRLAPGQRDALCRLHAEVLAARFEAASVEWPVMDGAAWLVRYGPDADNLRAAMQWAFDRPDAAALGVRLAAAGFPLWWELPGLPLREARHWYGLAMARIGPETPHAVQGWLWLGQSWTDTVDGDVENYAAAERAVRLFRAAGDPIGVGAALWRAASTLMGRDHDPSTAALLDEALGVLAGQPATKWRALCHVRQADLLQVAGAMEPALAMYDRIMPTMQASGHSYGLMVCGGNRSYVLFALGRHEEAVAALHVLHEALPPGMRHPLVSLLAIMHAVMGDAAAARRMIHDSLAGTPGLGMSATLARTVEALSLVEAGAGNARFAARLLGFVLERHPPDRMRMGPRQQAYTRLRTLLQAELPPAGELDRLLTQGAVWSEAELVTAARAACPG